MKPLFLEIQAFGPFADKQTVDFEKLGKNGIFLIKGKTGSGKTSIYDAMVFALYGKSSGASEKAKGGRNDLENWRCNQTTERIPTYVSFTFSNNDKVYRFTRKLVPKPRAAGFDVKLEAGEVRQDGTVMPFSSNLKIADMNKKAEEIIGLTCDQFCQVVLLPQGQFENFLTANSEEKEKILSQIFKTEDWGKYTKRMFDDAYTRKTALDQEIADVRKSLAEEDLHEVSELEEMVAARKAELRKQNELHTEFNGDEKQKILNVDRDTAGKFESLHNSEKEKAKLEEKAAVILEKAKRLELANKAEAFRPAILEINRLSGEVKKAQDALTDMQKNRPETNRKAEAAGDAFEKAQKESPVAELHQKKGRYEEKRSAYQNITRLKKNCDEAQNALSIAGAAKTAADRKLDEKKKTAGELLAVFNAALKRAAELRTGYFAGIYGTIASELTEGVRCPVCGSLHHPAPAPLAENNVSKAQMEQGEKDSSIAKEKWEKAEKLRSIADEAAGKAERVYSDADKAASDARTKYEHAKESLIPDIPDENALNAVVSKIDKQILQYEANLRILEENKNAAEKACIKLEENIRTTEENLTEFRGTLDKAVMSFNTALAEKEFDSAETVKGLLLSDSERSTLHAEVVAYDDNCKRVGNDLANRTEAVSGLTEPDKTQFEARQKEILTEAKNYISAYTALSATINRLEKKYTAISKRYEHYINNINRAETDLKFAKKLRGDTGISLERYVLSIMFSQVLGEANRMLANMHGGRYQLYTTKTAESGNKAGLDLNVRDNQSVNGEGRSVGMLSGGEKFLVSLALSIGLSNFAQKAGNHIEALFIDEGFGTLDDSSIEDAMNILESVRGSNGMIGIISHVALLEGPIPTHLEVVKTDHGNYIRNN